MMRVIRAADFLVLIERVIEQDMVFKSSALFIKKHNFETLIMEKVRTQVRRALHVLLKGVTIT